MGRAKLKMELITKEKSRNVTYKKRKEGLMRKMHEFSTLCDVDACIIIYGPTGGMEAEIWPQEVEEMKRVIGVYKSKKKDSGSKSFGLPDFFQDRKKKVEQDLTRLKRKNLESRYPTWQEYLNLKTESELRSLSAALTSKYEHVRSRVDFLKRMMTCTAGGVQGYGGGTGQSQSHSQSHSHDYGRVGGLDLLYQQALSSMHVRQDHCLLNSHYNNSNENDGDVQIGGASSSTFLNRQILYQPKSELVTSMPRYSLLPPPYLQFMSEMPPPPIHYFQDY